MTEPDLPGKHIVLRPSVPAERELIYEWAVHSDVAHLMMGPPIYPESSLPTYEEFCTDHTPHFFDGSAPELGRCFIILHEGEPVGQVYYNDIFEYAGKRRVELDIWMRAEKYCGKGFGSDALLTLCIYLARELGVEEFMVQPSARNPRAIRAYEKIGFTRLSIPIAEAVPQWGPNDTFDSVYMVKTIPAEPGGA